MYLSKELELRVDWPISLRFCSWWGLTVVDLSTQMPSVWLRYVCGNVLFVLSCYYLPILLLVSYYVFHIKEVSTPYAYTMSAYPVVESIGLLH